MAQWLADKFWRSRQGKCFLVYVLKTVTFFRILDLHSNELFKMMRNKSALTSPGNSSLSKLALTATFPEVIFYYHPFQFKLCHRHYWLQCEIVPLNRYDPKRKWVLRCFLVKAGWSNHFWYANGSKSCYVTSVNLGVPALINNSNHLQ